MMPVITFLFFVFCLIFLKQHSASITVKHLVQLNVYITFRKILVFPLFHTPLSYRADWQMALQHEAVDLWQYNNKSNSLLLEVHDNDKNKSHKYKSINIKPA